MPLILVHIMKYIPNYNIIFMLHSITRNNLINCDRMNIFPNLLSQLINIICSQKFIISLRYYLEYLKQRSLHSTVRIFLQGYAVKVVLILLHIDLQFRNSFCFAIMYRKSVKTITSKEYHNSIKAQKQIMVSPEIKKLRKINGNCKYTAT